jgi:membrane protein
MLRPHQRQARPLASGPHPESTGPESARRERRVGFSIDLASLGAVIGFAGDNAFCLFSERQLVAFGQLPHKPSVTICGLTGCLAFISSFTVFVFFSGNRFQNEFRLGVRVLEWIGLAIALSLAVAVLYRFGPSVRDAAWRWSTPGVVCALILWIGSTFGARFSIM